MIPKIIHYCWFGRGELPPSVVRCIQSWKTYCPDWEIRQWNEDNAPIQATAWSRSAYRHRKYAFVSDYIRFWALLNYGGVYLDTDMLLFKPLDDLLGYSPFIGRVDDVRVNLTVIGAEKGDAFCQTWVRYYESARFNLLSSPPNANIDSWISSFECRHDENGYDCLSNGLRIYPYDWFSPLPMSKRNETDTESLSRYITENTVAVHLWCGSWKSEFQYMAEGDYTTGFRMVKERLGRTPFLPFRYYMKLLKYSYFYLRNK